MTEFKNGQMVRARQSGETLIYVGPLPGYNSFSVVCNTKGVELASLPTTALEPLPEKRKVWVNLTKFDGLIHAEAFRVEGAAIRAEYAASCEVLVRAYEIEYEVKG